MGFDEGKNVVLVGGFVLGGQRAGEEQRGEQGTGAQAGVAGSECRQRRPSLPLPPPRPRNFLLSKSRRRRKRKRRRKSNILVRTKVLRENSRFLRIATHCSMI